MLDKEIAAPTTTGVRSVLSTESFADLEPATIARILKDAEEGNASAYFALAETIEEKYLHYLGVIGTRKRQVSQLDITVDAASDAPEHKKHAALVQDWLKRDMLEGELFDILDAVGKGISYTEIVWDMGVDLWLPKALIWRNPKGFEFDKENPEKPMMKNEMGGLDPLQPYKFITHIHPAKSGLPIRGGLARSIMWAYLFQNFAIKDWVIFAEVFGMPIRLGKYDTNASATDKAVLLRAVRSIGTDAAAIVPQSMQIEFVNFAQSGSVEVYERLCQYLDQQVSKAVLGQTATTDAVAGGLGGSQGNVHNDVRADIERADAKLLAVSLNRDLVRPIIDFNFGPPKDKKYPQIKIGRGEELSEAEVDMLTKLIPLGLKIPTKALYSKLRFEEPKDGEPVLEIEAQSETIDGENLTAEKMPKAPTTGKSGAVVAKNNPDALLEASYGSYGANLIAAATTKTGVDGEERQKDEIDLLVDKIDNGDFGGWEPVMAPILDPVLAAIDGAKNFEELKDALIPAMAKMDSAEMAALLAKAVFNARALGEAQIKAESQIKQA